MPCSINPFSAFSTHRIAKRGLSAGGDADKKRLPDATFLRQRAWLPVGAWHKRLRNLERERDAYSGTDREIIRRKTRRRSGNENHRRSFFGRGDRPRGLVSGSPSSFPPDNFAICSRV